MYVKIGIEEIKYLSENGKPNYLIGKLHPYLIFTFSCTASRIFLNFIAN